MTAHLRYAKEVILALPEELIRLLVRRVECAGHRAAAPTRRVSEGDARVLVGVGRLIMMMIIIMIISCRCRDSNNDTNSLVSGAWGLIRPLVSSSHSSLKYARDPTP